MQFYDEGFRTGDPEISDASATYTWTPGLPECVDVLISGSGPAGLMLAAQLSREADITTRVIEKRTGPLLIGQADGVASRSIELLHTFGIAEPLIREAYWINETTFWGPSSQDPRVIERAGRVQDVPDDASEFPHVVVNQARLQEYLLQFMRKSPTRLEPDYGFEVVNVEVTDGGEHPVTVTLKDVSSGAESTVRAKYVVGCDGAHSTVRKAIGREMIGDFANHAWGVMDVLAETDFPDVRLKSIIQSADAGNILLIPREGGYLFRIYVDLGTVDPTDRSAIRKLSHEDVAARARAVLHPYTLDIREVAWFSIYEVGQRVTDGFDDVPFDQVGTRLPRVFIAGDACHTHSAKAGQGMNVSMPDANNLAWKLVSVLTGRAAPHLLSTYSAERQPIAQGLIDFDKAWSSMIATAPDSSGTAGSVSPATLQEFYVTTRPFTTGIATHYPPSTYLTSTGKDQGLATGFTVGKRFHSAPVIRVSDARRVQLGHVHRSDSAFRLYAFADAEERAFAELMEWLDTDADSPLNVFTPEGASRNSVIDTIGILQRPHREVELGDVSPVFRPRKGALGLTDREKVFCPDFKFGPDIFDERGISRTDGAIVLVRPDQYVAAVLPLSAGAELRAYFDAFLTARG